MPQPKASSSSSSHMIWRPTKIMNMRDLSRDDDFLSHLLVEKLGTGAVPLIVHKMDASRTIPKANPDSLINIVRNLVTARGQPQAAIREAVDELLLLPAVRHYLKDYEQKQINAFATHASRYFELYLPSGSIEIAHTSRYSHKTGKSELCILATRPLMPGQVITELKGSMADLTEEEDLELKRIGEGTDGVAIRRDFSVIHSKQLKKNHLFLGPARFVNHDCDHNVELFREGRYITFRVIKPIGVGEEVTAHYGDGYFGRKNRHCLCETCEKHGRGGYAVHSSEDELSDSAAGSPRQARTGRRASVSSESESENEPVDVNERRTRRGVYAVVKEGEKGKEKEVPSQAGIELEAEVEPDVVSELTSLGSSGASLPDPGSGPSKGNGLMTPDPEPAPLTEWLASTAAAEIPREEDDIIPPSTPVLANASISAVSTPTSTPSRFRSVISTRSQKAKEDGPTAEAPESISGSSGRGRGTGRGRGRGGRPSGGRGGRPHVEDNRQLPTPPLTSDSSASVSVRSSSRLRHNAGERDTDDSRLPTPLKDKADGTTSASVSTTGEHRKAHEDAAVHSEARTLRPRQFHLGILEAQAKPKMPEDGPRGVDGKLLPTCMTCHNILPVIHVEGKPVWGLGVGRTGKRGRPPKNPSVECPRCMRHFEIYGHKWPERLAGDGSTAFLPTPRDTRNSTPITASSLALLDRKLAFQQHGYAMPKRPYTKRKHPVEEEDSRPAKKLKPAAPTGTGKPRGRPPKKNKVGMSSKAQLMLNVKATSTTAADAKASAKGKAKATEKAIEEEPNRRSGRTRMPSMKLRESETPAASRLSSRSRSRVARPVTPPPSSSALSGSESEGRPELPQTPVKKRADGVEVESPKAPTPKSLAVAAQPRESNGRFGRKSAKKPMNFPARKNRSRRVLKGGFRAAVATSGQSDDGSEWESVDESDDSPNHEVTDLTQDSPVDARVEGPVSLKRSSQDVADEEEAEPSSKKIRMEEEGAEDEADSDDDEEPVYFRPSLITGPKPGVGLLRAPNPVTFARRKWATARADPVSRPASRSRTTDEETDPPVTPELDAEPEPAVAYRPEPDSAEEDADPPPIVAPASFVGKLTLKPSPINLSRRRWAPPPPRVPSEVKADEKSHEEHSAEQRSPSNRSAEGYWSDKEEWGYPWTESEDDGADDDAVYQTSAPPVHRAHAKGHAHPFSSSAHGSPSHSKAVSPQSKAPAMNWKRTMLRDGVAYGHKTLVSTSKTVPRSD